MNVEYASPGYIKYLDFSFGTWETCYLVKIDDEWAHIIEPFTYEWLNYIGKTHWIEKIQCNRIKKDFFQHKYLDDFDASWYQDKNIYDNLLLDETCVKDLFYISEFIRTQKKFYWKKKSLIESIETAIDYYENRMDPHSLDKVLRFYMDSNEEHKERLLLLLSPSIHRRLLS